MVIFHFRPRGPPFGVLQKKTAQGSPRIVLAGIPLHLLGPQFSYL